MDDQAPRGCLGALMVSLRHKKVASGSNNPNREVSKNAWNDEHALTGTAGTMIVFDAEGEATEVSYADLLARITALEGGGVVLQPLSLSASSIAENSAPGTLIGPIQGATSGSVVTLLADDGGRISKSGNNIVTGATALDYEATTNPRSFVLRETLGASVLDTTINYTVTNVLEVTLAALGGTFTLAEDAAAGAIAGAMTGRTIGSTLSLLDSAGGRVALSGTNITRGATALDYETATSHSFTLRETHPDATNSPRDTVLSLTVTDAADAGPALSAPTLARYSPVGTPPLVLTIGSTDYVVGLRGQLQIDNNSDFSSPEQNIVFFIDGDSWARLDEATGFNTPTGTYYARFRILRDNESGATTVTDQLGNTFNADASAWSNTVTDTISVSSAVLNTATGTNKSAQVTVSGTPTLSFATTAGTGGNTVRSTLEQATSKAQFEVTVTTTGLLIVGVEEGTANLNSNLVPGYFGSATGVAVSFSGTSDVNVSWNNQANNTTLTTTAGSIAVGDVFTIVVDTSAHTLEVHRTRSGTTVQIGSTVSSIPTLSHYYAFAGTFNGNSAGTMNFGATTYAKTPGSGVAAFWA